MKINESAVAAAKAALGALWEDACDISRAMKDGHVMEQKTLYSDVPCHLSAESLPVLEQDQAGVTATRYTLYVAPEQDVREGDGLLVRHKGRQYRGVAGNPYEYGVNKPVPMKVVEIA